MTLAPFRRTGPGGSFWAGSGFYTNATAADNRTNQVVPATCCLHITQFLMPVWPLYHSTTNITNTGTCYIHMGLLSPLPPSLSLLPPEEASIFGRIIRGIVVTQRALRLFNERCHEALIFQHATSLGGQQRKPRYVRILFNEAYLFSKSEWCILSDLC